MTKAIESEAAHHELHHVALFVPRSLEALKPADRHHLILDGLPKQGWGLPDGWDTQVQPRVPVFHISGKESGTKMNLCCSNLRWTLSAEREVNFLLSLL